jgi:limonene-1,2-epoxide hydrolase
MSNFDVITAFCEVWAEKDLDKIMGFFTDDAVYHNIPMDPANVGKDQIRAVIESFTATPESIEFKVHCQAEDFRKALVDIPCYTASQDRNQTFLP